ncbi:uncharacterized protein K452DRAFT_292653 [Aplosporella prunicola CBS 121167]|uniref:Pyruvate decarboxylase n=1 Tax=Aplosporella prunicola CBS 121167 TaxID=1176127 RepID=A0A6A6AWP2_9PEZI|nr:uncharacterized protein K452DRAFT_292653 [Aplosporella prunicola CBS 121167]KAF2136150.1 hypothetical protein K452DRAFT_292653 [Aplosporella prunicola CBS 121167]
MASPTPPTHPAASADDTTTIPLGQYLWARIRQLGTRSVIGVPGDFNLHFLDHIALVPGLRFVGAGNELNAAYAADGYARAASSASSDSSASPPGVLVTTHGVGELSALNGVAGAHAEHIAVVHVVGQTPRALQRSRACIHHGLSSEAPGPDHQVYAGMSEKVRIAAAKLWDVDDAPTEIDRVLAACVRGRRPVYVFLPLDLSMERVPRALLERPLDLAPPEGDAAAAAAMLDEAANAILELLGKAKKAAVFVDVLTARHGGAGAARRLIRRLGLPVFSSNMGKAIVDETDPLFVGCLNGRMGRAGVFERLQEADLVILLGDLPGDTNTGFFSRGLGDERTVFVGPFDVRINDKTYAPCPLAPLLTRLLALIPPTYTPPTPAFTPLAPAPPSPTPAPTAPLAQAHLWPLIAAQLLKPHDIVLAETGTASFGLADTLFPPHVQWHAQSYYGSIGWATGAAAGAGVAVQDGLALPQAEGGSPLVAEGRVVLVTGDGSFQLAMQEVGTMVKHGLPVVIVLVNNGGYTIERIIHGAGQAYNDINPAAYAHLLPLFRHPAPSSHYRRCSTFGELSAALKEIEAATAAATQEPSAAQETQDAGAGTERPEGARQQNVQLLELITDKLDVPWRLMETIKSIGPHKVAELEREGFAV